MIKEAYTRPAKAKIQLSHTKQMVITFFNWKEFILNNYMPRGQTASDVYIIEGLGKFMKIFRQKRPIMVSLG